MEGHPEFSMVTIIETYSAPMKENAVVTCFFVLQSVLSSIHDIIHNI